NRNFARFIAIYVPSLYSLNNIVTSSSGESSIRRLPKDSVENWQFSVNCPNPSRGKREQMHKPVKYVEKAVTVAATGAWAVFERLNRVKPNPSPKPKWSDKPLLKSYEKTKPPLGWPRSTDSLCPRCIPEIRQQILD